GGGGGREPHGGVLLGAATLATGLAGGSHRPRQHRRPADRNVFELQRVGRVAVDRDQVILFLGPLARRLRQGGEGREIKSKDRYDRQKAAPGRWLDTEAIARVIGRLPCLAHRPAPTAAARTVGGPRRRRTAAIEI